MCRSPRSAERRLRRKRRRPGSVALFSALRVAGARSACTLASDAIAPPRTAPDERSAAHFASTVLRSFYAIAILRSRARLIRLP
jgi:hypothetical protein